MPITEAQLLEKEAVLKKVQTRLNGLLNDDIPDEEQPEILELKKKVNAGLMTINNMKSQLAKTDDSTSINEEQDLTGQDDSATNFEGNHETTEESAVNNEDSMNPNDLVTDFEEKEEINCSPNEVNEEKEALDPKSLAQLKQYAKTNLERAQKLTERLTFAGSNTEPFNDLVESNGGNRFEVSEKLDAFIEKSKKWSTQWENQLSNENEVNRFQQLYKEFEQFRMSALSFLNNSSAKKGIPPSLRKKIIHLETIAKPLRAWLNALRKATDVVVSIDSTIILLKELNGAVSLARVNNPAAFLKFTSGQVTNRAFGLASLKDWGKVKKLFTEGEAYKACEEEYTEALPRECLDLLSGKVNPAEELKKIGQLVKEIRAEIDALNN